MNFEEMKAFIEQNKENNDVKAYLQGLNPLTVEGVQKYLNENQDAKKWLDSEKDKHLNKGLETWKTNNLSKLIDEEVKRRYPEADPKDVELKKLQAQIEQMQKDTLRKELTNKALKIATDKKLPVDLVDYFIANDENATVENLKKLEEVFSKQVDTVVKERLGNGYVPPKDKDGKTFTLDDIKKMSEQEINKNWDVIAPILKNNK